MLGSIGAVLNPDATADIETGLGTEAGSVVQPTQPPYPLLHADTPSGYPYTSGTILGDSDTSDIADIYGDFSVVATPLASVSGSGVDVVSDVDTAISVSAYGAAYGAGSIRNPLLYQVSPKG